MKFKKYHSAVKYLEDLANTPRDQKYMKAGSKKNPGQFLARPLELCQRLGNIHQGFKFIHISGTSGKGSTVEYVHNILKESGLKVGSFTSPYCSTSIEKIKSQDKLISPDEFAEILNEIKPQIKKMEKESKHGRPSYFEIFLAMALLYFKKTKREWVVLEVGCGGRYDATNIIEKSISATTSIGLDHTAILGKTLPKIAKEKAGIIKPNSYFFTTEQRPVLLEIFKKICQSKNTKFNFVKCDEKFQEKNKALAGAIASHIGIAENIIEKGIKQTELPPCRFEIIQKNPLIILDGAHNPDKMRSVVHNLKSLTYGKLYTIFSASENKDAEKMLKIILPKTDEVVFTEFETQARKSFKISKLKSFAKSFKAKSFEKNSQKALSQTLKKLKREDALIITGSLYLTGGLRKNWIKEEKILEKRNIIRKSDI